MTDKQLAKDLINAYFQNMASEDKIGAKGIAEMIAINSDDKVLLEHIKAWINILTRAKEEIENEQES